MAMKRTKTPWMRAEDFGRSLPLGIGVNLLVPEIAPMEAFCRDVLGATVLYADEDFAAVTLLGSVFMLHADHSYQDNPMAGVVAGVEQRGTGIEIRIYGLDRILPRSGRERTGTTCLPVRSTSRTASGSAISSGRAFTCSCRAWLSRAETLTGQPELLRYFCNKPVANRILTISG